MSEPLKDAVIRENGGTDEAAVRTEVALRSQVEADEHAPSISGAASAGVGLSRLSEMRRGKKAVARLDDGRRDDGASQVIEELVRYLEEVHGDLYLWRLGEIDAETAMTAIRDTLEGT